MKLFTNLSFVAIVPPGAQQGVRTSSHALLIEPWEPVFYEGTDPLARLRGFGVEGSCPIFDYALPGDSYKSEDWNRGVMISDGEEKPLMGGQTLSFDDGPVITLWVEDATSPIQIDEIPDGEYDECWELLRRNVRRFWQLPRVPHLAWTPSPSWDGR